MSRLRSMFGGLALLLAFPAAAQFTGTWSGQYSGTTHCQNGVVRNDSGPITLALTQTGASISGVATLQIPFLNEQCQLDELVSLALPISGTATGNNAALRMVVPGGGDAEITATVSGTTMSLTFTVDETMGTASLTRTSSQGSGPLTGTYAGTVTATYKQCTNGQFIETDTLDLTLLHAGEALTGTGQAASTRHVDVDSSGACRYHDIAQTTFLLLSAQVRGSTVNGLLIVIGTDPPGHGEEEEIPFVATVSGNTIAGGFEDQESRFEFTLTRTSTSVPPRVTAFEADAEQVVAGQSVTLHWDTLFASSVTIDNGVGTRPATGSVTVTPAATTTYRLTANGPGGTATATTTVNVVPAGAPQTCNLTMTLTCPPLQAGTSTTCTAVTINQGASACTGTFFTGFFSDIEPPAASFAAFQNPLGLPDCFDNNTLPGAGGLYAFCFGDTSLAAGAQFQQTVRVTPGASAPPRIPIAALTGVFDPVTEEDRAFVSVMDEISVAGCTPSISAPAVAQSGGDYLVSWTPSRDANATFTLEESTTADFSANVSSFNVAGLQRTFGHAVTANTTYYYRVRPNSCSGGPGTFSEVASTVVQAPITVQTTETDVVVPFGSRAPVTFELFVKGLPGGTANFTATADQPFLSVSPSSGTVSPAGRTITVTATPTDLPAGANTGTITVVVTAASAKTPGLHDGTTTSTPVTISLVTPVAPGGKSEPPPNSLIIPVVTHVNGATGPFLSDVRLVNTTGAPARYQLLFTPTRTDGTKVGKVTEVSAATGQTLALNDVVKDFFGLGASGLVNDFGFGVLEIRPLRTSSTRTFASSRTYVRTEKGTLGQFIAAVLYSKFAGRSPVLPGSPPLPPRVLSLQQVAQSQKFRTNFGIVEGSGSPASGRYRLYDSLGTLLAEVPWSLEAGEHQQLNGFISTVMGVPNLEDGRIEVIVDSLEGAVTAYASVLDNKTTDPMAVMPVEASEIRARRYTIPGMAEFGGGNNFHSDVRVYNGGTTAVTVTPTFYTIHDPSVSRTGTPFTVAAGEMKVFDNVLPTLFGPGVTGGSIVFTTAEDSSLVVTGRTYTIAPDGGTFGQFIPGLMPGDGMAAGDPPLQLLQLEQSQNYRTNVGLVEVSGEPAKVRLTFSLPDTKTSAIMELDLAANHYTQLGRVIESVFGPGNYYNVRISIEVLSGPGRVTAYGSVLDNATLDPTYVPAQ